MIVLRIFAVLSTLAGMFFLLLALFEEYSPNMTAEAAVSIACFALAGVCLGFEIAAHVSQMNTRSKLEFDARQEQARRMMAPQHFPQWPQS
jgi:hypothetical protein